MQTIKPKKSCNNGIKSWLVEFTDSTGQRKRLFRKTEAQAQALADELNSQRKEAGEAWLALSADERNQLMMLWKEAKDLGQDLRQMWAHYRTAGFLDVVPCSLPAAIKEAVAHRTTQNLSDRYLQELEKTLNKFAAGHPGKKVHEITKADVVAFLDKSKAVSTRSSTNGRLASLFSYCFNRLEGRYCSTNPCAGIEHPGEHKPITKILTVEEAAHWLYATREVQPLIIPLVVLGMFDGIRPEELERMSFGDIHLADAEVLVDGKTNADRIVPLQPVTVAWLRTCTWGEPDEPISPGSVDYRRQKIRDRVRQVLPGFQWVPDLLRHSAASYQAPLLENLGKLAFRFGNSEKMLRKHYLRPVSAARGREYFSLTPERVEEIVTAGRMLKAA